MSASNTPSIIANDARKLVDAGRYADAMTCLLALVQNNDAESRQMALAVMWSSFYRHRCHAEIADAVTEWQLARPDDFGFLYLLVDTRAQLDELPAARAAFARLMDLTRTPEQVSAMVKHAPKLYQGRTFFTANSALLARLDQIAPLPRQSAPALAARAALMLATGDLQRFQALIDSARSSGVKHPALSVLFRMDHLSRTFETSGGTAQRIFGIGLSKTGTTSLHSALATLGLHTAHWTNPVTGALLHDSDIPLFDALTDTPISHRFEELYYRYPTACFIYTHRDPVAWEKSMLKHYAADHRDRDAQTFESLAAYHRKFADGKYGDARRNINLGLYFNHASLAAAYASFDRRVRSFFADRPEARFLAMDIVGGQGWPELCGFLGSPQPATPFPWEYKTRLVLGEGNSRV